MTPIASAPVPRPVMLQRWARLTFLHWPYPPAQVQRLLPEGLRVDTFDGRAWVGLVPFHMRAVRLPGLAPLPWVSNFLETNIRTYVLGPDDRPGIWFSSLDVPRLGAAAVAQTAYRLPYVWAQMRLRERDGELRYYSRRRWPGPRGAGCLVGVRPGPAYAAEDLDELDHFLTARWGLYSSVGQTLTYAPVEHAPWPLRRAAVTVLRENLTAAAGLEPPAGPPRALYSQGVDVRIGLPRRVGRSRT